MLLLVGYFTQGYCCHYSLFQNQTPWRLFKIKIKDQSNNEDQRDLYIVCSLLHKLLRQRIVILILRSPLAVFTHGKTFGLVWLWYLFKMFVLFYFYFSKYGFFSILGRMMFSLWSSWLCLHIVFSTGWSHHALLTTLKNIHFPVDM